MHAKCKFACVKAINMLGCRACMAMPFAWGVGGMLPQENL